MRISPRLQFVFDNLLEGRDVWDFCCDHGFLGGAAYESRKFRSIYFVDQIAPIIDRVSKLFETYIYREDNLSKAYFFAKAGQQIDIPVTGTICITGVGAFAVHDILAGLSQNKMLQATRLILGPHRDEEKLLCMISDNSSLSEYQLTSKSEILENGRKRIFFIFDR